MEVLDNKIEERWLVRTQSASPEAGWVPPTVLIPIGRDETDGRSSKTTITSGEPVPLFVTVPFWSTDHSLAIDSGNVILQVNFKKIQKCGI